MNSVNSQQLLVLRGAHGEYICELQSCDSGSFAAQSQVAARSQINRALAALAERGYLKQPIEAVLEESDDE